MSVRSDPPAGDESPRGPLPSAGNGSSAKGSSPKPSETHPPQAAESDGKREEASGGADELLDDLRELGLDSTYVHEPEYQQLVNTLESMEPTRGRSQSTHGGRVEAFEADSPGGGMVGRFQLRRPLGRGSFGIVYLAIDTLLQRPVAVKVPRAETVDSPAMRKRFLRESRAASGLNHHHILPVYEAGEEGAVFIASQYCPGPSLAQWLAATPRLPSYETAARLVADMADATEHAHQSGVLHRDIKPGNILLQPKDSSLGDSTVSLSASELPPNRPNSGGETPDAESFDFGESAAAPRELEHYVAKLTDFGLAKFRDQEGDFTATGALVGTVKYMSPEQATGNVAEISERSDVYALGVLLYELLTGQTPLAGENEVETIRNIVDRDPTPPRKLAADIPRDLDAICLQCLHKNPARRYASAGALRDDLERFLFGESIIARRLPLHEQVIRWTRQRPAAIATVAASLAVLIVGVIGLALHSARLQAVLRETEEQRQRAKASAHEARSLLYAAEMRLAIQAWRNGDPKTARDQLTRCKPLPDETDHRGFEWRLLAAQLRRSDWSKKGHDGPIYCSVVTPDQKLLATAGKDGVIRVWNARSGALKFELRGHQNEINDLALSPDGQTLASTSDDRTVRLWDLNRRELVRVLSEHSDVVYGVAFSPDGRWLVTGGKTGRLLVRDSHGKVVYERKLSPGMIEELVFFADSQTLAVAIGGRVELWDIGARKMLRALRGRDGTITNVAVSPDGRVVAGGGTSQLLILWEARTGRFRVALKGHSSRILDVKFTPDGRSLVSASVDGTIRVWPLLTVRQGLAIQVDKSVHRLSVAPNGGRLATGAYYESAETWTAGGKREASTKDGKKAILDLHYLPDGQKLLVAGRDDKRVDVCDAQNLEIKKSLEHDQRLRALAVSPSGRQFAFADAANVQICSYPEMKPAHRLAFENARDLAFSRSGTRVAAVGDGKSVRVWDADRGELLVEVVHARSTRAVDFSEDEGLLITGDEAGLVRAWSIPDGELQASVRAHRSGIVDLRVSPDGSLLATASNDGSLRLWDTHDWRCVYWTDMEHALRSVTFSPEGTTLYTTGTDGFLRTWELERGTQSESIDAHGGRAWSLCFVGREQHLLSTGSNGELKLWRGFTRSAPPMQGLGRDANHLTFNPRNGELVVLGDDRSIVHWDEKFRRRQTAPKQGGELSHVAIDAQGRWRAVASTNGVVSIFDLMSNREHGWIDTESKHLRGLAFFEGGSKLATLGDEARIRLWDVYSRGSIGEITLDPETRPSALAISPDERLLAVDAEKAVRLFRLPLFTPAGELTPSASSAESLAFSPSGQLLASGHANGEVRCWDLTAGKLRCVLRGHQEFVRGLCFSADERTLVSCGGPTVRLWHLPTGHDLGVLADNSRLLFRAIAFSSDGTRLAAASEGLSPRAGVHFWRLVTGRK